MTRNIPMLLATAAFTLGLPSAHAQLGIYGKLDLAHYSDNSPTSGWFHGAGVGVYDDFIHLGPVHLGADVRGDFATRDNYRLRNITAGLRVAARLPVLPLRPYVEGLAGVGGTQYTGPLAVGMTSSPYQNKFTYQVLGGLDLTIFPHLDFRTIEIGVSRQRGTGVGNATPYATLVLLSAGLVLRL